MKALIKKITPGFVIRLYHWLLARFSTRWYGYPSRELIVIGVTGTKGKSTTCYLITRILESAGFKVGLLSTILNKVGDQEWLNASKQTMPGRLEMQRKLRAMVKDGCRYAVIETSSEGIAQFRHLGIDYDVSVFTNLSPEHIESHGSYEKYREAKAKLFRGLFQSFRKHFDGKEVKKTIVANLDDHEAGFFLSFPAGEKWGTVIHSTFPVSNYRINLVRGGDVQVGEHGTSFMVNDGTVHLKLLGEFNVHNALLASAVALSLGIGWPVIKPTLEGITGLPGRMEEINNQKGFRIFVDYAHEPASLEAVYRTVRSFRPKHLIAVLGSQGGGRDRAKRPALGRLAGRFADYVIVTNEDPYDEDPQVIIDEVAAGVLAEGKEESKNFWSIGDRLTAIQKALSLAIPGDIVLITGKGSETVMAVAGGQTVPWDDRQTVRDIVEGTKEQ